MTTSLFNKRIFKSDWLLIAANLLPVLGVWFLDWSPTEAFIVYALETMIVGMMTVLKMLVITFVRKQDKWYANGKVTQQGGIFFILFFIFHFGMFALVQTTIFSQVAHITPPGSGMTYFFFHFYTYINEDIAYMLGAFIIGYLSKSFIPFILNEEYKNKSLMAVMFEPYGRIFIQQFTVIIGSFFLTVGLGKIFILVFVLVKLIFETKFNYSALLNKSMGDLENASTK